MPPATTGSTDSTSSGSSAASSGSTETSQATTRSTGSGLPPIIEAPGCADEAVALAEEANLFNTIDGEPIMTIDIGAHVLECGSIDGWYAYAHLPEGFFPDCSTPVQSKICPLGWSPEELAVTAIG